MLIWGAYAIYINKKLEHTIHIQKTRSAYYAYIDYIDLLLIQNTKTGSTYMTSK
jgi:hypothetical protein